MSGSVDGAPSMSNPSQFLKSVPLFKRLPASELPKVASAMETTKIDAKSVVFKQGDPGDSFYIIFQGEAVVKKRDEVSLKVGDDVIVAKEGGLHFGGKSIPRGTKAIVDKFDPSREYPYTIRICETGQRGRVLPEEVQPSSGSQNERDIATLRAGDYFGEQSLLNGSNRAATIVAVTELICFNLTREKFKSFNLGAKLNFVKRAAVMAVYDDDKNDEPMDTTKNAEEVELIRNAIRANSNLGQVVQLDNSHLESLVSVAFRLPVTKGTVVIEQGDLFADRFYIVQKGEFSFRVAQANTSEAAGMSQSTFMGDTREGGSFGELALLYHAPRAATVTCTKSGVLWVVKRSDFKNVLMRANDLKMTNYMKILDTVSNFAGLYKDEKAALAEALVEVQYIKGERIITQGDEGDSFYILYDGQVDIMKDEAVVNTLVGTPGVKAETFGEHALLKDEVRQATVQVSSDEGATVLALSRSTFETILGPLEEILKDPKDEAHRRGIWSKPEAPPPEPVVRPKIEINQLKRLGLLGCGGFGAVTLEQHKTTGQTYALKALSKGYVVKMRMQKSVMREKEILAICDSPFIVKLYATYKSHDTLFFLLEPCMGGELFATYHKHHFHGSVTKAKFYSVSVVYAFEHLHERHVLYRDLKPENLLLDSGGFCKLTDMGLAKVVTGKTYTTCGTPDYFAPEVIQQTGMTQAVDWWTLGILIHELLCGHAPFEASDPMDTYRKIVRGVSKVQFMYADRDPSAVQLVQNLLKHVPNERLPMRAGGSKNIKTHAWYNGTDWDAMLKFTVPPPYVPQVKNATDMTNFRAQEADLPPQIPYKDNGSTWDADF
eukprot:GEMP01002894.1.p1 GENE.GEMP01002894.1~~GEMP01002894.1.p1  ORF type:complete len:832 (-),score=167.20 GEMP01002894.1:1956-4451(-)